jgi:hypothetical protein
MTTNIGGTKSTQQPSAQQPKAQQRARGQQAGLDPALAGNRPGATPDLSAYNPQQLANMINACGWTADQLNEFKTLIAA